MKAILMLLANLSLLTTIFMYHKNMKESSVTPNATLFLVRSIISVSNAITYFTVVNGDFWKTSLTITSVFGLVTIFFHAWVKGKFAPLRVIDAICLWIAFLIMLARAFIHNDVVANLLLQGVLVLSFWPTIDGVRSGKIKERWLPWSFAVLAYFFLTLDVIIDWKNLSSLVHPIVTGMGGNGCLAYVVWRREKHLKQMQEQPSAPLVCAAETKG